MKEKVLSLINREYNIMRGKVRTWMNKNLNDYVDECNEVNCTQLAENACQTFDLYKGDDIPEWIFDLAADVGLRTRKTLVTL